MNKVSYALIFLVSGSLYLTSCKFNENRNDDIGNDWPVYGGNSAGNRFSPLDQINKKNVKQLQVAWTYNTGENVDTSQRGREIQCQPIIVNTVMYGTTPELKVFAVNAENGKELWKFDPFVQDEPQYHSNRGVVYWEDGDDKRILFTAGSYLYAINAENGKLLPTFGNN